MNRPLAVLLIIMLMAICAPLLSPAPPQETNLDAQLSPPNFTHLLGTDYLGRDVWSRTLYGGRRTLFVGTSATIFAVILGGLAGFLAGSANRFAREFILHVMNAILAFPSLLLALIILTLLGGGAVPLILATGLSQIVPYARVVYNEVRRLLVEEYVTASHSMGAARWHIFRHHVWPNAQATLLSYAGIILSYSIINSAALSLLGLGGDPSVPDWGSMLWDGRANFRQAPWIAIAPGVAMTITIITINKWVDQSC